MVCLKKLISQLSFAWILYRQLDNTLFTFYCIDPAVVLVESDVFLDINLITNRWVLKLDADTLRYKFLLSIFPVFKLLYVYYIFYKQ